MLPLLRADGKAIGAHVVTDPALTLGVNTRVELAHVRRLAQERIHRAHALAGVTIVDPASTLIEVGVEIGRDTIVEPGTFLRGATRIGARCEVGPLTTLIDTVAGDDTRIVHSYLQGAELGSGVSVGPFAYLRPAGAAARQGEGRHVRGDQEQRRRRGHEGAAPLLHRGRGHRRRQRTSAPAPSPPTTTARTSTAPRSAPTCARACTPSFVAPVKLGDGSYTGAGSVITDDVPDGALGIARERQTNVEGYADRRKER